MWTPEAEVLVLFTYQDGYPTIPLGVYSDVNILPTYPEPWREVPSGWNRRGGFTTRDLGGTSLDLVRYRVF